MSEHANGGPAELFDRSIRCLDRVRRTVDAGAVEAAIGVLLGASDVLFAGVGPGGIVGQDAVQKSALFGVPCRAPAHVHRQLAAAAVSGPRSVTFAISRSGRTAETVRVACAARDAGAAVIAMTGRPGPLSEVADVALVVPTGDDTDAPGASWLAGLVVVDVVATGVMLRRGAGCREDREGSRRAPWSGAPW